MRIFSGETVDAAQLHPCDEGVRSIDQTALGFGAISTGGADTGRATIKARHVFRENQCNRDSKKCCVRPLKREPFLSCPKAESRDLEAKLIDWENNKQKNGDKFKQIHGYISSRYSASLTS